MNRDTVIMVLSMAAILCGVASVVFAVATLARL